jgi:hypothetical protein
LGSGADFAAVPRRSGSATRDGAGGSDGVASVLWADPDAAAPGIDSGACSRSRERASLDGPAGVSDPLATASGAGLFAVGGGAGEGVVTTGGVDGVGGVGVGGGGVEATGGVAGACGVEATGGVGGAEGAGAGEVA